MPEEEKGKDSGARSTIDAVAAIVKALPIYDDAVQPAAKQVGKILETVAKSVIVALAPIRAMVWGYEQIEFWITKRVTEKLIGVPAENILTPPPEVAGPAMEALRFVGHDSQLRELYASLIAASMNRETSAQAHPAFVEVLRNLSSDEAVLLRAYVNVAAVPAINIRGLAEDGTYVLYGRNFSHLADGQALKSPGQLPAYVDNLVRLGILEVPREAELSNQEAYVPLEVDKAIEPLLERIVGQGKTVRFERTVIRLTAFGGQFVQQVVTDK